MWNTIKKYWLLILGGIVTMIGFIFKDDIRESLIQEVELQKKRNDDELSKNEQKIEQVKEQKQKILSEIEQSKEEIKKLESEKENIEVNNDDVEDAKERLRQIGKGN